MAPNETIIKIETMSTNLMPIGKRTVIVLSFPSFFSFSSAKISPLF